MSFNQEDNGIERLAHDIAELGQIDQLHVLEGMHRRIRDIGNARVESMPAIEGAPEPGQLGGRFALLSRTIVLENLFYITDTSGVPTGDISLVPLLPSDEYDLMRRINDLGTNILSSLSPEDMRLADRTRPLRFGVLF